MAKIIKRVKNFIFVYLERVVSLCIFFCCIFVGCFLCEDEADKHGKDHQTSQEFHICVFGTCCQPGNGTLSLYRGAAPLIVGSSFKQ